MLSRWEYSKSNYDAAPDCEEDIYSAEVAGTHNSWTASTTFNNLNATSNQHSSTYNFDFYNLINENNDEGLIQEDPIIPIELDQYRINENSLDLNIIEEIKKKKKKKVNSSFHINNFTKDLNSEVKSKRGSHINPRVIMEARQQLAREKKERENIERIAKLEQLLNERKTLKKVTKEQTDEALLKDLEKTEEALKKASDLFTQKSPISLYNIKSSKKNLCKKNLSLKTVDNTTEAKRNLCTVIKNSVLHSTIKEEGNSKEISAKVLNQVEQMFYTKQCIAKRKPFSAWRDYTRAINSKSKQIEVVKNWKLLNANWNKWKSKIKKLNLMRLELEKKEALRTDRENLIKAMRFYRVNTISKAFVQWIAWNKFQKQERLLILQHRDRTTKIADYLKKLESKHHQESFESVKITSPASADKLNVDKISKPTRTSDAKSLFVQESVSNFDKNKSPDIVEKLDEIFFLKNEKDIVKTKIKFQDVLSNKNHTEEKNNEVTLAKVATKKKPTKSLRSKKDIELINRMETREKDRIERQAKIEEIKKIKAEEAERIRQEKFEMTQKQQELEKKIIFEQKLELKRLARQAAEEEEKKKRIQREKLNLAKQHYASQLERYCIFKKKYVDYQLKKAKELKRKATLNSALKVWRPKAILFSDMRLKHENEMYFKVEKIYIKYLRIRMFEKWKLFIVETKDLRYREFRKKQMRDRVKELLMKSRFEQVLENERIDNQI
ncbi:hypothetical protein HDU92_003415 [Lobulomyces angularis]|nr:hypothetical protein HDU92_003415 [Lobulomyces angularis]